MATSGEPTAQWKTTIIISSSLQNHDTCRTLGAQQHRIRFSDSVEAGSFIFPLSGTAFLLVDPKDVPEPLQESGLNERIEKFVQVHRNCFLLLYSPFNGSKELKVLAHIQHRFLGSNLKVLPVRNTNINFLQATSKPHVDKIRERMSLARARIVESSPVWEMLKGML
uniref:Chromosome 1 open reading frame 146 n=1 Tax=Cyprinodon variegatus TaxID=28743 RepID=A0A3Q2CV43_CYPVA